MFIETKALKKSYKGREVVKGIVYAVGGWAALAALAKTIFGK